MLGDAGVLGSSCWSCHSNWLSGIARDLTTYGLRKSPLICPACEGLRQGSWRMGEDLTNKWGLKTGNPKNSWFTAIIYYQWLILDDLEVHFEKHRSQLTHQHDSDLTPLRCNPGGSGQVQRWRFPFSVLTNAKNTINSRQVTCTDDTMGKHQLGMLLLK